MAARLLFFGPLRDKAGLAERFAPSGDLTVGALIDWIATQDPELGAALKDPSVRVAVDRAVVMPGTPIAGASEIAFMPPYSGG